MEPALFSICHFSWRIFPCWLLTYDYFQTSPIFLLGRTWRSSPDAVKASTQKQSVLSPLRHRPDNSVTSHFVTLLKIQIQVSGSLCLTFRVSNAFNKTSFPLDNMVSPTIDVLPIFDSLFNIIVSLKWMIHREEWVINEFIQHQYPVLTDTYKKT